MVMLGRRGLVAPWVPPIVVPVTFVDAVVADGPKGWWRQGEPSGTNANDLGSGNVDGTYVNSVALAQAGAIIGDSDTAALYSGTPSEYMNVVGLTTVPALVSVGAWVKGAAFSDNGLAGWYDGGNVASAFLYLSGTNITWYIKDLTNDTVYAAANLANGNWHYILGTYDGAASRLYYDGALVVGPITKAFAGGTSNNTFKVGQYGAPSGTAISATIDEPYYFDFALSAARQLAHYRAAGY